MKRKLFFILLAGIFLFQACKNQRKRGQVPRDTTVNKITSFNTLFFDSAQLSAFIDSNIQYEPFSEQFDDFYSHRNYEYAWFDTAGLTEQAYHFINLQHDYISRSGDSSIYNDILQRLYDTLSAKGSLNATHYASQLSTELMLSGQFFRYAAKTYKGSNLNTQELGWFIPRKKIDLAALLDTAVSTKDGPEKLLQASPQYKKLEEQFFAYTSLAKNTTWDSIPTIKKTLRKGDSAAVIPAIKQRLVLLGDLQQADSTEVFDSALTEAVRSFQLRTGLYADGRISAKTISELNTPLNDRIRQMLVNMERMRWMPAANDTNFILVNIPEYKMHVFDSGKQVFDMNVIVGTAANNTVIFSGKLQYVVFSPYWNVPSSIVKKEILPAMSRNSNYLARNNMEITGKSGGIPEIRQKPGPGNSLGLVKFLFPNNYNIYFHDTPNRGLFNESSRSFSHGCIRLGEPKKLAEYLLRADTTWNSDSIDKAMHLSKEKWVPLKKTVPVYITYFTAWVDQEGKLNFRKDIYGHDAKMAAKLFAN
ncbi:L,D-transpeptidase family protein [Sediminibacterium ginsengisoli]|uniref:Murein L,D-transpeptidase YcbB/YkuD n=1 Tax=Sediminibacterium ginsengisoli TaxID=413434 RepID=A0A1T4JWL1_9BACT|nr:L,D-transpeptidase family protein [Sediminibacterium ginsengisoli]SJZ34467.1 Murein L,D-transpeptidase YcbB/YkuD [Sediminibacterium ginsengisoli]